MKKKIPAVRFSQALLHVVKEAAETPGWQGTLQFPIMEPPSVSWLEEGDIKIDPPSFTIPVFTFHWYQNAPMDMLEWKLSGPPGQLKGSITQQVLQSMDHASRITFVVQHITQTALHAKWIESGEMSYSEYAKAKKMQIASLYGADPETYALHTMHEPTHHSYADSGRKLEAVIPGMTFLIPEHECPGHIDNGCQLDPAATKLTFQALVIHLNDYHKWPRSKEDRPPKHVSNWDMSYNIADWSEEYAIRHNLDMNFRTPEEMEEIAKKKAAIAAKPNPLIVPEVGDTASALGLKVESNALLQVKALQESTFDYVSLEEIEHNLTEPPVKLQGLDYGFKSLKEQAKDWSNKYDSLLGSKWKDILGKPGGGEGA